MLRSRGRGPGHCVGIVVRRDDDRVGNVVIWISYGTTPIAGIVWGVLEPWRGSDDWRGRI